MSSSANETAMKSEVTDRENYVFIMNVSCFTDFEKLELVPGHEMRRANEEEIDEIRTFIKKVGGSQPFAEGAWEQCWSDDGSSRQPLEPDRWRYFVITFPSTNNMVHKLIEACDLSSAEPEIGPIWYRSTIQGMGFQSERVLPSMSEAAFSPDFFIDLCKRDVEEIVDIHGCLSVHDHAVVDLNRVVSQLRDLKALPRASLLRFLGYFAVLESLLTHLPQPSDPYDSITRQIKKKLALLNRRFPKSIDYASFGGATADTIWGKMYQYRSLIAHGASSTFDDDLQILRNHQQALALVRATTKAVARQALREPGLIADLRDC